MAGKRIFTISWKIVNFSLHNLKYGKSVLSPVFIANSFKQTKWFLEVYPKGEDEVGTISYYLHRSAKDECESNVTISYMLEIIDFNGKILESMEFKNDTFKKGGSYGAPNFLELEKLTNYLKNGEPDYFVFRCQAFTQNEQDYSELYQVQSEYQMQNSIFQSKIHLSDFQKYPMIIPIPFETQLPFIIRLTTTEDKIVVKFLKERKLSSLYEVKITILDDDNDKIQLEKSKHLFDLSEVTDSMPFETYFEKGLVKYVKNSFPYYSFKLVCCVSSFKGDLVTSLESHSFSSNSQPSDTSSEVSASAIESLSGINLVKPSFLKVPSRPLQNDLKSLFLSEKLCDVKLRVGKKIIAAHKCLLSARSPVFSAMFNHDMVETTTGSVDISDIDSETLQSFIEYLYTDTIKDTNYEQVLKLIVAADKYHVSSLRDNCCQILMSLLSEVNACEVLSVAEVINHENLKHFTMNFIKLKKKKILFSPHWEEWVEQNMKLANELFTKLVIEEN